MLVWLIRLAWRRVRRIGGPAVVTLSITGLSFTLDWAAAEHVPLREILVRGEYWPIAGFRPDVGQTVVDVGANAGVYAVVAGSRIGPSGRLIAIEPNPAPAGRLMTNLRANGLLERSVVIEAGLSDHAGRALLFVGSNSTIATFEAATDRTLAAIDVPIAALDAIADKLGLADVDLLKVDVEGSEAAVLGGASAILGRCRRAVIEVSLRKDVPAVIERCSAAGFDGIVERPAGVDSGATIVFAERR